MVCDGIRPSAHEIAMFFITQNGALFTFLGLQLDIGLLPHFQLMFPKLFAAGNLTSPFPFFLKEQYVEA